MIFDGGRAHSREPPGRTQRFVCAGSIGSRAGALVRHASGWTFFGSFGLGVAATLGILVAALEVSVAAIPLVRGVDPILVNRAFKGDRAPALPGASRVVPEQPQNEPKLPDGCIAVADWRGNIFSDEVPGRCVA
jgi:hypothetical protein